MSFIIPLQEIFEEETPEEIQGIMKNIPQEVLNILRDVPPEVETKEPANNVDSLVRLASKNELDTIREIPIPDLNPNSLNAALKTCIAKDYRELFEYLYGIFKKTPIHSKKTKVNGLFEFSVAQNSIYFVELLANKHKYLDPFPPMNRAISHGFVDIITKLLKIFPEIDNIYDFQKFLTRAIRDDNLISIKFFLDKGALIHSDVDKPFLEASKFSPNFLKFFFESGETVQEGTMRQALLNAVHEGYPDIVELLVKNGASLEEEDLEFFFEYDGEDFFDYVQIFIENGLSPRAHDDYFLKMAVDQYDTFIINFLLREIAKNDF